MSRRVIARRVVFDTGTLVSAALRIGSVPYRALLQALGTCDLCASQGTLAELDRVLQREKFDRYLDRVSRHEFAALIRRSVHLFAVEDALLLSVIPSCRDPKDNQFLALALAAEAEVLVSGDEDLLVLHPWRGLPIVTPAEFLLRSGASPPTP
jgi:putative PIN family toxin of toxin-antitoxin system